MSSGNLVIKPLTAKLTRDTETFGKMDPFCKITMGQQFKRTGVCQDGGKNPGWKDELSFRRSNEDIIQVEVWDHDVSSKDDLIGQGTIAFSTIQQKGNKFNDWVPISYKGKSSGQVLLDVQFFADGTKGITGGVTTTTYVQPNYGQPQSFPIQQQQNPFGQQQVYVQPSFPQQQVYVQPSFPQQQTFPQQQVYPQQGFPQQQVYPQQGFPQQQQGYPQQQQQGYPQQQQGYPQQQGGYPQQGQGGYYHH